jgi:tetratricopeptide (TPR) repeat protein
MPETARILQFPRPQTCPTLSAEESREATLRYLDPVPAERTEGFKEALLSSPDVLFALCARLRDISDSSPAVVGPEAGDTYGWLAASGRQVGLFDERDYLLGEFALVAGGANRLLGKHVDAELWLDRAEASFRHTVNSTPNLANVAYARLALRFQTRRFQDVLELIPSLEQSYERLGMVRELAKSRFLEAMCLKQSARDCEASGKFRFLAESLERSGADPALLGHVLIEVGSYCAADGRGDDALREYGRAAALLREADRPMALAHLKVTIGETLKGEGKLTEALTAFRSAVENYLQLEMTTFVAYTRLFVADVLLALDRARQAEWEILQALPTIEEQKMVPEGFAAVALLKESVRRRQADPDALRQLREHLQANKA